MSAQVVCIGECMLELSGADHAEMTLSYGGDTLNTAVYLARLGVQADYVTALGDDPYSDWMIDQWEAENVGTRHVVRVPDHLPGLYAIRTDQSGERQFHYWRDQAPVRALLDQPDWEAISEGLPNYALIYLSGITLSLFTKEQRERLNGVLDSAREKGCTVAFDTNYRPRGWPSANDANVAMTETLRRVDIALPTLEDDRLVFGDRDADACIDRLQNIGVREIAVKLDAEGCLLAVESERQHITTHRQDNPLDTTGAGDSFNAGYLAARLSQKDPLAAVQLANQLAGAVIMHRGAVIPATAMPYKTSSDAN